MLELDSISKQVGAAIHIRDVSLSLERGSLNVLLGPTLAGKTSLMRLMAGLDRPTAGDIRIDGQSVTGVSVRKRDVAMVYQQFINYPAFTVYENIASPLRIAGADKATIDRKVREAAELLKLTEFLQRTPLSLSGGQQQRTALARALVKGAELVLMDEPLANLDYKLREELRVELPRLFAETGAIFVYATTEPHEALLLGGQTATLHEGAVTQFGNTIDVYNQPRDLRTAQVFSDPPMNTIEVDVSDSALHAGAHNLGQLPSAGNGRCTLALRPHHVSLTPSAQHSASIPAIVGTSEITGSETYIHVSVGEPHMGESHWVVLTRGVHRRDPGDTIELYLDPSRYYLFDADGELCHMPETQVEAA